MAFVSELTARSIVCHLLFECAEDTAIPSHCLPSKFLSAYVTLSTERAITSILK